MKNVDGPRRSKGEREDNAISAGSAVLMRREGGGGVEGNNY